MMLDDRDARLGMIAAIQGWPFNRAYSPDPERQARYELGCLVGAELAARAMPGVLAAVFVASIGELGRA